ncbi:hypothetical protein COV19_00135 [Candidatus Woesearchaeota archaeon CG10_big_fil_rev_8_21_14_0_10_44_13]|nr:MAG: hypothetical protein COV19_00135 [Candidatus Woesearchaeota archaeon CG10_big_fil_rev_8_21_14_0_10_44_13]
MKKRKNCLKCGIVLITLILVVIIVSGFVVAQEKKYTPKTMEVGGEVTNPPQQSAPQWAIDKANDYIISVLGEDYFEEHIKLVTNTTGNSRGYFFYYNYIHDVKDEPTGTPHQVVHLFHVQANWSGTIVRYGGPREPYQFLISSSEARDIAIQNGMKEPVIELDYGTQGYDSNTPIPGGTCVWVAWTYGGVPKGDPDLLFIHVDTGELLGKRISEGYSGAIMTSTIDLNEEKRDGESTQPNNTDKKVNLTDREEKVASSAKEETGIFKKIINWVKALFVEIK